MKNLDFEWLTDEFMLYCRSTQLREKTMSSYEQTLHLFVRWLSDELKIYTVDKITENVVCRYIDDLMVCGITENDRQLSSFIYFYVSHKCHQGNSENLQPYWMEKESLPFCGSHRADHKTYHEL